MNRPIQIEVVNRSGMPVSRPFLRRWIVGLNRLLPRAVGARRFRGGQLVIAFVTETEMKTLNLKFRAKNRSTDVLSFESDDPECLGEIAICSAVISRQAREHGLLVREELGYMILHGVLHLMGYDHETSPRAEREMFALQDGLFEKLLK